MKKLAAIALPIVTLSIMSCTSAPTSTPASPSPPTPRLPTPAPVPVPSPPVSKPSPAPAPPPAPAPKPSPSPSPTPAPPADTTPPPPITGALVVNAYDGKVNLWWDKSAAQDFDHYNVYLSQSEIADVTGTAPVRQIKAVSATNYQATGLKAGIKYYFAITAVDKNGNENRRLSSLSATATPMPRGAADPDLQVDVYQTDKVWSGTTLLADNHNSARPRVIEVNMLGEIVWQHLLPDNLKQYTNPGFDTELLPNNNLLLLLPQNGVYEIDRSGKIVWSYLTRKISHDADRLPNGNTIFAFGADDQKDDAQVTKVNPKGEVVWAWYAKNHFDQPPYNTIYHEGWLHTNAVTRRPNGNTLISPRNFNFVVEVDPKGSVVRTIGEGIFRYQHDPEIRPNGNILVANHDTPHRAVELDPKTGKIVWQSAGFRRDNWPVRDANRLPNGNTLITGTTEIVEVTPEGRTVWRLKRQEISFTQQEAAGRGFYKAERTSSPR